MYFHKNCTHAIFHILIWLLHLDGFHRTNFHTLVVQILQVWKEKRKIMKELKWNKYKLLFFLKVCNEIYVNNNRPNLKNYINKLRTPHFIVKIVLTVEKLLESPKFGDLWAKKCSTRASIFSFSPKIWGGAKSDSKTPPLEIPKVRLLKQLFRTA